MSSGRFQRLTSSQSDEEPESTTPDGKLVSFRQISVDSNLFAWDPSRNVLTEVTDDALSDFAPTATARWRHRGISAQPPESGAAQSSRELHALPRNVRWIAISRRTDGCDRRVRGAPLARRFTRRVSTKRIGWPQLDTVCEAPRFRRHGHVVFNMPGTLVPSITRRVGGSQPGVERRRHRALLRGPARRVCCAPVHGRQCR